MNPFHLRHLHVSLIFILNQTTKPLEFFLRLLLHCFYAYMLTAFFQNTDLG